MTTKEFENALNTFERVSAAKLEMYAKRLTNSRDCRLSDVYDKYSYAQERAYDYCMYICNELGGYNFRITSYNFNMFTVAFLFDMPNGYTAMAVIIPAHNYYCVYDNIERFV